jgi:tRNA (guanine37-N1)-methyltransferase
MQRITVITLHPSVFESYSQFGVLRRAIELHAIELHLVQLRDFAIDRHGTVDDRPYGGGDGMVLRPEPLAKALEAHRTPNAHIIAFSPGGTLWTQPRATQLQTDKRDLILLCGRFAGIDQRFLDRYVETQISLGDFVLSGGEIPALALLDSLVRGYPGVLGHADSAIQDSFASGMNYGLEHPLYTRPEIFEGMEVPTVLRSGDHSAIKTWRKEQSEATTRKYRADLLPTT